MATLRNMIKINHKKHILFLIAIAVSCMLFTPHLCLADNADSLHRTFANRLTYLFGGARQILFILGCFGIVGLSAMAYFGNMEWKWAGALALAMVLLTIGSAVIKMMTGREALLETDIVVTKIGDPNKQNSQKFNLNNYKQYKQTQRRRIKIMSKYTKDHEWVLVEGNIATVGISDHAQASLGDLVYVELPAIGRNVTKGEETAVVESVKAASDVYSPVSGKIIGINEALEDSPETINSSAEVDGWMWKMEISNPAELEGLMSEEDYKTFIAE